MQGYDEVRMRGAHIGLFETPILHGRLTGAEALLADLARVVAERRTAAPGIGRSNVGGWHSGTDMLDWGGPAAVKLAELTVNSVKRLSTVDGRDVATLPWWVRMWANVSPPGSLNMSHAHPGVLWAAVFYVDMGSPPASGDGGGELFFEDPRFPVPLMRMPGFAMRGIDGEPQKNERRWPTEAGDLVIFPAWLRHGVRPHAGTGDRVSIAMNIDVGPPA